jgi:hypothetical protein
MIDKVFAGLMAVCGLLTMTMLFATVAPVEAMQSMFAETPEGALAGVVVPTWGVLIGLMGALLLYGAYHAPSRKLALVIVGVSKIAFIAFVLATGYLSGVAVPVIADSIMVILFAAYLMFGKPAPAA